jgi:hypothetical protein
VVRALARAAVAPVVANRSVTTRGPQLPAQAGEPALPVATSRRSSHTLRQQAPARPVRSDPIRNIRIVGRAHRAQPMAHPGANAGLS